MKPARLRYGWLQNAVTESVPQLMMMMIMMISEVHNHDPLPWSNFSPVYVYMCVHYADVRTLCILASFPSPLTIARRGSMIPAQVNNTESVWSRLRTVNMSVSNFMSSAKLLPVKLTVRRHEADVYDSEEDFRQDIGRCASMPNMEQEFVQKHSSLC